MNELDLLHDVRAIAHLRESEGRLKEAARAIELVPGRRNEATRLYQLAERVRSERLDLLNRCGLS